MQKSGPETIPRALQRLCALLLRIIGSPYTTLVLLVLSLIFSLTMGIGTLRQTGSHTTGVSYIQRMTYYNESFSLLPYTNSDGDPGFPTRALLATLIAFCALRAAHELIDTWQLPPPARRLIHTEEFTLECGAQKAWERVAHAFSATGHIFTSGAQPDGLRRGTARPRGPGHWLVGTLYLGLCLLFLAPLLRWRWGWHSPPLHLSLGETRSLQRADVAVTLDEIAFVPRADGAPRVFDARLAVTRGENKEYLTVGLDRGARQQGIAFHYLGHGPAVQVRAQDDRGTALDIRKMPGDTSLQHAPRVRFHQEQQERLLSIPEADLILRLVSYQSLPAQGIEGRALQVRALQASTERVMAEKILTESGTIHTDDTRVDIRFEYYATLGARHEPALAVTILGGILSLLGLYGTVIWSPRRMWLIMQEGKGRCHYRLITPKRHAKAPWFLATKIELQEASDDGDH